MPPRTILLLMPRVGDMDSFRDRPTPPLSLIHAATLLEPHYQVVIVDQRVEPHWRQRVEEVLDQNPVAVGLTTLSGTMIHNALIMARFVRQRSVAPLVWGGIHITMLPEQAMRSELVDYAVLGEGEVAFLDLIRALEGDGSPAEVPGVWAREGDRVRQNPRPPVLDFADLPPAPYHLVDMEQYIYTHRGRRCLDYLSSRGCPHECTYCYNGVFYSRHWSAKPAEAVIQELERLIRAYSVEVLYFVDDNFFIDQERAWEILRALPSLGVRYQLQGMDIQSIDAMTDAELDLLETTGLQRVTIGIETASDRMRRLISKWGDRHTVERNLRRLANRRFLVLTSFIIGFPFESWEEIQQTIRFALDLQSLGDNFRLPQFYNYTPVQGTALARDLERCGFRFPQCLGDWSSIEWDRNHVFSDNPEKQKALDAIAFLSKFVDRKDQDYGTRPAISALYRLFRPLALLRLRAGAYGFLPEKALYEQIKGLL